MSNEYLVTVEAVDLVHVEAENEESAKTSAVEIFKNNPEGAAYNAEIIRETKDGKDTFPVKDVTNV